MWFGFKKGKAREGKKATKKWVRKDSSVKDQNLIILMIKPTNYDSFLEGEVFLVVPGRVFWWHIIGGLLSTR